MIILAAFILGFAGSFHCIGMCGPIAMALPLKEGYSRFVGVLIYNAGRIFTYSLLGAVFGLFGKGLALAGFQQKISVAIGVFILLTLLIPATILKKVRPDNYFFKAVSLLKQQLGRLLKNRSYSALLSIGVLNGFLPCGFVYMALAGAVITGSLPTSILYMAAFGAGTLPLMTSISYLPGLLNINARKTIRKAMPVITFFFAVLFIVRGLNLGIPYLSPEFSTGSMKAKCCHR